MQITGTPTGVGASPRQRMVPRVLNGAAVGMWTGVDRGAIRVVVRPDGGFGGAAEAHHLGAWKSARTASGSTSGIQSPLNMTRRKVDGSPGAGKNGASRCRVAGAESQIVIRAR